MANIQLPVFVTLPPRIAALLNAPPPLFHAASVARAAWTDDPDVVGRVRGGAGPDTASPGVSDPGDDVSDPDDAGSLPSGYTYVGGARDYPASDHDDDVAREIQRARELIAEYRRAEGAHAAAAGPVGRRRAAARQHTAHDELIRNVHHLQDLKAGVPTSSSDFVGGDDAMDAVDGPPADTGDGRRRGPKRACRGRGDLSGGMAGDHGGIAAAEKAAPDDGGGGPGHPTSTVLSWARVPGLKEEECFPIASVDGGPRDKRFLFLVGPEDARAAPITGAGLFAGVDETDTDTRLDVKGGRVGATRKRKRRPAPDDAPAAGMHGPEDWEEKDDGPSEALTSGDAVAPRLRVDLPRGESLRLEPTHDPDGRNIWYITGISGSGKTRMARWLCERYRALWPDRAIHYVSFKEKPDRAMPTRKTHPHDPVKVTRLLHSKLATTPLSTDALSRSLLVVDDVDNLLKNKPKAGRAVQILVDDVCLTGRSHEGGKGAVSLVYITHNASNFLQTRTLASEADTIVFFPRGLAAIESLKKMLQNFGGPACDRAAVTAALATDAKWVAIRKRYPFALVHEGGARVMPVGKFT